MPCKSMLRHEAMDTRRVHVCVLLDDDLDQVSEAEPKFSSPHHGRVVGITASLVQRQNMPVLSLQFTSIPS